MTVTGPVLGMRLLRSRQPAACFVVAVVAAFMLVIPSRVSADVMWTWSFGGTEAGTFTTNGTLANTSGSFNFTVTNFTVTSSTVASLVGRPYVEFQPAQGFLWNGVSATEFYRSSGSLTNGSNFYVSDPNENRYGYLFFADPSTSLGRLTDPSQNTIVGFSALTLTPAAVPEPSTYVMALAGLACGGYAMRRRKRA